MAQNSCFMMKVFLTFAALTVLTSSVLTASEVEKANSTDVEHNSTHAEPPKDASPEIKKEEKKEPGLFDQLQDKVVEILKDGFKAIKKTTAKVLNGIAKVVKNIGEDDKQKNGTEPHGNSTAPRSQRHAKASSEELSLSDEK